MVMHFRFRNKITYITLSYPLLATVSANFHLALWFFLTIIILVEKNTFMNLKTIYRRQYTSFTGVSNAIARSSELSVSAIGLMTKLLGNQEGFTIYKEVEQRRSGLGEKSFKKAWNELVERGFIIAQQYDNKHAQWEYTIINEPKHPDNRDIKKTKAKTAPNKPTPTNPPLENQPLLGSREKGDHNIDVINKEESNKEESNKEEINIAVDTDVNIDVSNTTVNIDGSLATSYDDIKFEVVNLETFKNTSTSFELIQNVPSILHNELIDDKFNIDTSIVKIQLDDFDETIERKKDIFLSYWYNRIDATPINQSQLKVYNNQAYFSCINWIFKRCLTNNNLNLQPERYFDVSINVFIDFVEAMYYYIQVSKSGSVLPTNVADMVMEDLQPDRFKLSMKI